MYCKLLLMGHSSLFYAEELLTFDCVLCLHTLQLSSVTHRCYTLPDNPWHFFTRPRCGLYPHTKEAMVGQRAPCMHARGRHSSCHPVAEKLMQRCAPSQLQQTLLGCTLPGTCIASNSGNLAAVWLSLLLVCVRMPCGSATAMCRCTCLLVCAPPAAPQVLFAYELQRRLGPLGIEACAVDPGGVRTAIWHGIRVPGVQAAVDAAYAPASDAAQGVVHAATVPWDTVSSRAETERQREKKG